MRKSINFLLPHTDPNRFSIKVENLFNRFWRFCFGGRAVWVFRRLPSRRDWSFRFCPLGSRLRAKFAANKRTWRPNKTASRRRWKQSKIISTGRFDVYGPVFTSSLRCGLLHKWMTFFRFIYCIITAFQTCALIWFPSLNPSRSMWTRKKRNYIWPITFIAFRLTSCITMNLINVVVI